LSARSGADSLASPVFTSMNTTSRGAPSDAPGNATKSIGLPRKRGQYRAGTSDGVVPGGRLAFLEPGLRLEPAGAPAEREA
jgi:hypothetical protein